MQESKVPNLKKIKNIVLDLDNTLISAEPATEFPYEKEGMIDKCLKFPFYNMDDYYIVFERPHLQEFLDFIFENYNVSIWTAATQSYALYIIQHIILSKPERKLDFIFFSYHCSISKKKRKDCTKDLSLLYRIFKLKGFSKKNTLIIDDLDEIYNRQPENCIHIKEFNILDEGSENDTELLKIKNSLSSEKSTSSKKSNSSVPTTSGIKSE